MFNKEGSAGLDVKVPSTSQPVILVWVNARTEEVQNCRQIAATNTVILRENQSNETSEGSGEPVAQNVTLTAKGANANSRKMLVCCFTLKRSAKNVAVRFIQQDSQVDEARWKT